MGVNVAVRMSKPSWSILYVFSHVDSSSYVGVRSHSASPHHMYVCGTVCSCILCAALFGRFVHITSLMPLQ
jgi:hypothetical protein